MIWNSTFLDFTHTIGGGAASLNTYPNILSIEPDQNNLIYFLGLIVALLTQIIVIYDYIFNFVICSPYLVYNKDANIRYLLDKFSLKEVDSSFIDKVFWPISLSVFFLEIVLCYIFFIFFHISLLWLSVIIWTISITFSFLSLTIVSKYIHDLDDIKRAVRLRDAEKIKLELRIIQLKPIWRTEEMNKHGENFTESLLEKRIEEYRLVHLTAINDFLTTDNLFIVEDVEDPGLELFEGTPWEWFEAPTHFNVINIGMYVYYMFICCQDSIFLFIIIYSNFLNFSRPDELEYVNNFFFDHETSNIIRWFIGEYTILFSFF